MLPSSPITTATHTAIDTLNPSLAAHVQVTLRVGHCAAAADLCHVIKVRFVGKGALKQSLHIADMSLEQWLALWRAVGDAVAIATSCAQLRSTRAAVVMVGPAARPLAVGERSDLG